MGSSNISTATVTAPLTLEKPMPLQNLMNVNNRFPSNIPKPKPKNGSLQAKTKSPSTNGNRNLRNGESSLRSSISESDNIRIQAPVPLDSNEEEQMIPDFSRIINCENSSSLLQKNDTSQGLSASSPSTPPTPDTEHETDTNTDLNSPYDVSYVDSGIGLEAQVRFQKARIKALTVQLNDSLHMKKEAEESQRGAQRKSKEEAETSKRLQKSLFDLKQQLDKAKEGERNEKELGDGLKREVAQLKRDLAAANKVAKTAEQEHKGREIRLSRALEECEKFKAVLAKATSETKAGGNSARKENDKLVLQVSLLIWWSPPLPLPPP